jgi:potassium channel
MVGVLKEIENMLARGRLDLPITLCFAVNKGDDLMLHQLLKRGLDPNESDNNGHTALVCIYLDACVCKQISVTQEI